MRYDIDGRVEETAHQLAFEQGMTTEELWVLQGGASNSTAARVYARAIELQLTGLPH